MGLAVWRDAHNAAESATDASYDEVSRRVGQALLMVSMSDAGAVSIECPERQPGLFAIGEQRLCSGRVPREKGIDVALAVGLAVMAARTECAMAVVCSVDTDILPALEYAPEQRRAWGRPIVEVAAWSSEGMKNPRLSIRGGTIWCHWIREDAYNRLRDDTDYNLTSP